MGIRGGGGEGRCYLVIIARFNAIKVDAFESVGGFNVLIIGISGDYMGQTKRGGGGIELRRLISVVLMIGINSNCTLH